jgi:hypothetical protein
MGFLIIQARLEEVDLLQRLSAYREYMEQVPRFVPYPRSRQARSLQYKTLDRLKGRLRGMTGRGGRA